MVGRRDSEPVTHPEIDDALRARAAIAVRADRRLRRLGAAVDRALFPVRTLPGTDRVEIGALR